MTADDGYGLTPSDHQPGSISKVTQCHDLLVFSRGTKRRKYFTRTNIATNLCGHLDLGLLDVLMKGKQEVYTQNLSVRCYFERVSVVFVRQDPLCGLPAMSPALLITLH